MKTWTYEKFRSEVKKALIQRKMEFEIDVSDTSEENALEVVEWAKKDGLKAELCEGFVRVRIF